MNLKNQTLSSISSCLKKTAENIQYVMEKVYIDCELSNDIIHSNFETSLCSAVIAYFLSFDCFSSIIKQDIHKPTTFK